MSRISIDIHPGSRLDYLDGLRAVAVTWVVLYHYLRFWTSSGAGDDIVAYDNVFAGLPLVGVGSLGVNLFFVIFGFVILMTLERSADFTDFMVRRLLRLWPALLLFGTATYLAVRALGPEELHASLPEYLFSMAFIPPEHVGRLLGSYGWQWLDGAYWSLFVEMKFYVIIGCIFFAARGYHLELWMAFGLVAFLIWLASLVLKSSTLDLVEGFLFQSYIPYFSFGMAAYLYYTGRRGPAVVALAVFSLLHIGVLEVHRYLTATASSRLLLEYSIGHAGIFLVVALFILRGWQIALLDTRPVVVVGRCSYGIYLLHQNVGISILALPLFASPLAGAVGVVTMFAALIFIAHLSYTFFEHPLQVSVRRRMSSAAVRALPATTK